MAREYYSLYNLINEQIEARYGRDSGIPHYGYYDSRFKDYFRNNSSAMVRHDKKTISPNIASMLNCEVEDFSIVCKLVDIDLVQVRRNFEKIRKQSTDLVVIGYGGFSINSMYFMSELATMCSVYQPFSKISIYENDELTFLNSMRIFKDLTSLTYYGNNTDGLNKLNLFKSEKNLSRDIILNKKYFSEELLRHHKERSFFVGAPDLNTRVMMQDKNFIFSGHSGNEVELYSKPVINQELTTETYGTINVFYFFLNVLKATEILIDIIANSENLPPDTSLFKYNSEIELAGKRGGF